jgi:hypothetical protein
VVGALQLHKKGVLRYKGGLGCSKLREAPVYAGCGGNGVDYDDVRRVFRGVWSLPAYPGLPKLLTLKLRQHAKDLTKLPKDWYDLKSLCNVHNK